MLSERGDATPSQLPADARAHRLPILTFHALDSGASPIAFPPRLFEDGLDLLVHHGYRTLSLAQAAALVRAGAGFPARAAVLTFDDGYRSVFDEALPRLRARGFSATLFLTTGQPASADGGLRFPPLCGREMLCWDEVAELTHAGWEVGAHTVSHPNLSRIPFQQALGEMAESRRRIEERLGTRVTGFAYPYGRPHAAARVWLARELGCACGVSLGLVSTKSDPFALERVDTFYLRSPLRLPLLVSPWLGPYLHLRRGPRALRAWLRQRTGP